MLLFRESNKLKKILLISFVFIILTIDVSDDKKKVIENDVPDLKAWVIDAIEGKYNSCKKRIIRGEIIDSVSNKKAIPAGEDAILKQHFDSPGYKNRKQRDSEKTQ